MAYTNSVITNDYAIYNGDSVEHTASMPSNSVDLVMYSPPFAELYNYSSNPRDMSNCVDYNEFLVNYKFLVNDLYRVTVPGRLNCIHCMDVKKSGITKRDFPGDIIRLHEEAGFHYVGRILIWKEPLRVALRTRVLSLRHGQLVKDTTKCNPAGPDYILLMRKPGNAKPVVKPFGLQHYAGELDSKKREALGLLPAPLDLRDQFRNWDDPKTNKWAHWIWRNYASPVWMDVRAGHLLSPKGTKEKPEEKHVCPLQLDVIERCIQMWSNQGDVVYSPFGGIGSEPYKSIQLGRRAIAVELKPSYFNQMSKNLEFAETYEVSDRFDLFDNSDDYGYDVEDECDFDADEIGGYGDD